MIVVSSDFGAGGEVASVRWSPKQLRHEISEHSIANAINGIDFTIAEIQSDSRRPNEPGRRALYVSSWRDISVVRNIPNTDKARLVGIPRRGFGGIHLIRVAIIFHSSENLSLLRIHGNLTNSRDTSFGSDNHCPRRYVSIVGTIKDKDARWKFCAATGNDQQVADWVNVEAANLV